MVPGICSGMHVTKLNLTSWPNCRLVEHVISLNTLQYCSQPPIYTAPKLNKLKLPIFRPRTNVFGPAIGGSTSGTIPGLVPEVLPPMGLPYLTRYVRREFRTTLAAADSFRPMQLPLAFGFGFWYRLSYAGADLLRRVLPILNPRRSKVGHFQTHFESAPA